jgi:hypothetical protein
VPQPLNLNVTHHPAYGKPPETIRRNIMETDEYRINLKAAYDPSTPSKDFQSLLDSFLRFKSETINHRMGCSKEVEEVILRLKEKISSSKVSYSSNYEKYYHFCCNFIKGHVWPIVSAILIGIILMFIQQNCFPPK